MRIYDIEFDIDDYLENSLPAMPRECLCCGRIMSAREANEQRACNDCRPESPSPPSASKE